MLERTIRLSHLSNRALAHSQKYQLDQKFWRNFASNVWEQRPLIVENFASEHLCAGAADLFELLVTFSDRCRRAKSADGFKLYIDGQRAFEDDILQILPVKDDANLLAYHERMSKMFPDYCLVCDELLQCGGPWKTQLAAFTAELFQYVGLPNRFAEMGLYLGNYRKTPFGVHVDRCGVFSFPVMGEKKFRVWNSAYVEKHPRLMRSAKYTQFKSDSELLCARPGDMTYWPSSDWHIAESDGRFSATWSLGVWVDRSHQEVVSDSLQGLLQRKLVPHAADGMTPFQTLHARNGEIGELPDRHRRALDIIADLSKEELHDSFMKTWMQLVSQGGLKNPSPPKEILPRVKKSAPNLKGNVRLRLADRATPVLWKILKSSKKSVVLGFGGITTDAVRARAFKRFLRDLNGGEVCRVGEYFSPVKDRAEIHALEQLAEAGAFIKVAAAERGTKA